MELNRFPGIWGILPITILCLFFLNSASGQQTNRGVPSAQAAPVYQDSKAPKSRFFSFLRKEPLTHCAADDELAEQAERARLEAEGKCVIGEDIDKIRPNRATVIRDSAMILDMLENHIEEWGHASFSEVVLMPDFKDTQDFSIDNHDTYATYKKEIQSSRQGTAAITETITNSLSAAGGYGREPADESKNKQVKFSLPFSNDSGNNVLPADTIAKIQSQEGRIEALEKELEKAKIPKKTSSGISAADLQVMASSTTVTGKVLNFMSNPINLSEIHQAYIGVTQVSVSPGWRTQRDYFCEVQVAVEYARMNEEKGSYDLSLTDPASLKSGRVPIPSVFAAFPLAQAQVLDLDYTSQLINSITLAASAQLASKPIKASMMMNRMKDLKQTLGTTTALPVVVPSSDGKSITYRFQPSVHALADPTNKRSGPGWRMNPISIPAMIVVICEKQDLVNWDKIGFTYSTRWVPMKINAGLDDLLFDRFDRPLFPHKRQSNVKRLHNSAGIDFLICNYFWMLENQAFLPLETRSRVVNLRNLVRSHRHVSEIPAPAPHIDRISPTSLTLDEIVQNGLLISGDNFLGHEGDYELSSDEVVVRIDGVPMEVCDISNNQVLVKACPETIGFLQDKVREHQSMKVKIDQFIAATTTAELNFTVATANVHDAYHHYQMKKQECEAAVVADKEAAEIAMEKAAAEYHFAVANSEIASKAWRKFQNEVLSVQEMYAGGSLVTLQNRYGKCECPNHIWMLPRELPLVASAITRHFPIAVTPDEGDFTITVSGYGFEDEEGRALVSAASLGGFPAKEVKVVNPETVLVSFAQFSNRDALNTPEPLILVGESGVVKYEGSDATEFPMIQASTGEASSPKVNVLLADYHPKTADPTRPFGITITGSGFMNIDGTATIAGASIGGAPGKVNIVNSGTAYITFDLPTPGSYKGKSEPLIVSSGAGVLSLSGNLPLIKLENTPIPDAFITEFFPEKVNPKADFTITVTGKGFEDANGNEMIKMASIGSLPAVVDVVNSGTVVLTFRKLDDSHQLNAKEPLILVGENGIVKFEGPSLEDFPLVTVEGGKPGGDIGIKNAYSSNQKAGGGFWKSLGQMFGKESAVEVTKENRAEAPRIVPSSLPVSQSSASSSSPSAEFQAIPFDSQESDAPAYRFSTRKKE